MTQVNLNETEARLIAVYRAIVNLEDTSFLGADDVGYVFELLSEAVDLDKATTELTQKEIKQLLRGFVIAIAAQRRRGFEQQYGPLGDDEEDEQPAYIEQSGVRTE